MHYVVAVLLTLLNAILWLGILVGLPGTWLMILGPVLLELSTTGTYLFGVPVLATATALALSGEVLEFALGALGSKKEGGSNRAAVLALVGGVAGGLAGTALPLPVLGTLFGACVGAFAGSLAGDLWAGRTLIQGVRAGRGAALGRLYGTASKVVVGGAIFVLLGWAAFFGER